MPRKFAEDIYVQSFCTILRSGLELSRRNGGEMFLGQSQKFSLDELLPGDREMFSGQSQKFSLV